ncbi:hypothetical protein PENSPDRAFT_760178 [Peniophora sp. CONT]|nr:hypothetical protein PENSPDRAFT_760178 [Peniophora sp. CONT]
MLSSPTHHYAAFMPSLHSFQSGGGPDNRNSDMAYGRVSSYDCEPFDSKSIGKTSTTSRSSSTVALARRVRHVGSWTVPALMLGSYILAIAFVLAHHIFLSILDGKDVQDFGISQTWVRDIGNALARIVQILLESSVGVALTQSIWFYVRRSTVNMPELDDLFSLPSIASIPFATLRLSALYVLPIAANIQTFSLVGIFAPNSLSLVPAGIVSSALSVPFPDLDRIPATDSVVLVPAFIPASDVPAFSNRDPMRRFMVGHVDDDTFVYISPSTRFRQVTQGVLSSGAILPWEVPAGCGLACNYSVIYHGPSLQCQDMPQDAITVVSKALPLVGFRALADSGQKAFIKPTSLYNATTTLGNVNNSDANTGPVFLPTLNNTSYSLSVVYATSSFDMVELESFQKSIYASRYRAVGSYCVFYNATYNTSVAFSNGTQTTQARVLEYGEPYLESLANSFPSNSHDGSQSSFVVNPDLRVAAATLGIIDAMSRYLTGSVSFTPGHGYVPLYTQILDSSIFSVQTDNKTTTISPAQGRNLSRALEDLCTNLTASLMSDTARLGIYTTMPATILPDQTIYEYQPSRLWLVYSIALLLALFSDLFGLACMRSNGVAMQRNFSSIAASMRAPELNELLHGPEEPPRAAVKVAKLRYRVGEGDSGEKSGFRIVDGGDRLQMDEVKALNEEEQT